MERVHDKVLNALIIDDEIDICYFLTGILKKKEIPSLYVNSLFEAKAILKTYFPALVFLDNHLPDGLGLDFIAYIKDVSPHTSIVIITANDSVTMNKSCMANTIDFIRKPFTRERIDDAIDLITPRISDTVKEQNNARFPSY
jgi:two-component system, OmpR family, response regulator